MMKEIHLNKENVTIHFDTYESVKEFERLFDAYNHNIHMCVIDGLRFMIMDKPERKEKPNYKGFSPLHVFKYHVLRNHHPWNIEHHWDNDKKPDGTYTQKDLTRLRLKDTDRLMEVEVLTDHRSPNGLCYDSQHYYGRNLDLWEYWDNNTMTLTTNYMRSTNDLDAQTFNFVDGETEIIIKTYELS